MIVFVTTHSHRYTHATVAAAMPAVRVVSYPVLFARRSLPRAAYIFTDFDRLGFWQLEVAAHAYRTLQHAGCRVLNDPARALQRLPLLRTLRRAGVNSFDAWPATDAALVDAYPVFVRAASAHRGVLTPLLPDAAALGAALEALVAEGHPLHDLVVIEYRAEPLHDDVFRKLAFYRVGDALVPAPSVHERAWAAKAGEDGVAGPAGYADDLVRMRAFPHRDIVRRAFEAAAIEYGRADAGIVDGRLEVYEINTNPMMRAPSAHDFADRTEAIRLCAAAYQGALAAIDTPAGPAIPLPRPPRFGAPKRRLKLVPGYQWLP